MSDDQRVELRQKALDMASKGLGPSKGVTRRGPVHEGSPESQRAAAERMTGEKRVARDKRAKAGVSLRGGGVRVREVGPMRTNTNAGSPRAGKMFTTLRIGGKTIHQYENGPDVVVGGRKPKESSGTGNNTRPRSVGRNTSDELQSLALRRANRKRGGGLRHYFSRTG